jgi:hypothetical protein
MKLKNYAVAVLAVLSLSLGACSGSKEARTTKKTINGDWTLAAITVEGVSGKVNAKVFNESDYNCFTGSTWNFVANNSSGSYTLPGVGSGCTAINRKIRWSIYEPAGEEKRFQFKRLDDKNNPMDDNNGYRLNIVSLTDSNMLLKSTITYENKPASIIYNFSKNKSK